MSTPIRTADTSGKIIKDGNLRHRYSAIGFQKWRQRYVAFKVTNSGRLEFIIYKEAPAIPDNEIKHVTIDEYGGLETNLKLESERYTFAIITNSSTECFSVDTPQEMTDWTKVIQEYLGKELVLHIMIPFKQNVLRAGKAQLRIRNLGFTITTCENPPKAQGSWQIIHIRKYGGTESFKFETGSRCPSGECLYTIQTEDNKRVKTLFSELSQHRPIFTDDRVGRRMTLEKGSANTVKPPCNRLSLPQPPTEPPPVPHLYENRDAITSILPEGAIGRMGRRHSAAGGEEIPNPNRLGVRQAQNGTPGTAISIEDLSNRQYANWTAPRPGRSSPTKKLHHQLPVDYYSVTPPPVLKAIASSSTPPSSPETDKYLHREEFLAASKTTGQGPDDEYSMVNPARMPTIIGDHIMFKDQYDCPGPSEGGGEMYQNLKFLHENGTNHVDRATPQSKSTDSLTETPQPVVTTDGDWAPHNYANVQMALEAMKSKERKRSEPAFHGRRDQMQPKTLAAPRGLKSAHSTSDLANGTTESPRPAPDYYNMVALDLPANSTGRQPQLSSTLSLNSIHQQVYEGVDGDTLTRANIPLRPSSELDRWSRSPVMHMYDTLIPLPENKDLTTETLYDKLPPLPGKSSSSSPEPLQSPTELGSQYQRKPHKYEEVDVELEHSGGSGSSDGVFSLTSNMEHPLAWMTSSGSHEATADSPHTSLKAAKKSRVSIKDTNSQARQKHLPLQTDSPKRQPRGPTRSLASGSKPISKQRKSRSATSQRSATSRHSGSSDEASSFELIPDMLESLRSDTVSPYHKGSERPRISNIQVELVKEPTPNHTVPPPLPPKDSEPDSESRKALVTDTPPLPPRPHHRVPLPPVNIEIDKRPTPPKPKVLYADTPTQKYAALTFGSDVADFDDSAYSAVNVNQPVLVRVTECEQHSPEDRVSYSAVNFPVMNALHKTIVDRTAEIANS